MLWLAGTETCPGAWQHSLHRCTALLRVLLPATGAAEVGSRLWEGRSSGYPAGAEGGSGRHAEEGDGRAGGHESWRLGEHRGRVQEGGKSHLGGGGFSLMAVSVPWERGFREGSRGPYCRKPLKSQAQQSPRVAVPLVKAERGAGQWVLPKGVDPALQKASLKGGAASRGLCPFLPVRETVWLSHQRRVQILCVWRRGDITGYACVRGGKGLLRLLHLPLPTCLCRTFHVSVTNGVTPTLEDAIRAP